MKIKEEKLFIEKRDRFYENLRKEEEFHQKEHQAAEAEK
jgi:hypothetical protein